MTLYGLELDQLCFALIFQWFLHWHASCCCFQFGGCETSDGSPRSLSEVCMAEVVLASNGLFSPWCIYVLVVHTAAESRSRRTCSMRNAMRSVALFFFFFFFFGKKKQKSQNYWDWKRVVIFLISSSIIYCKICHHFLFLSLKHEFWLMKRICETNLKIKIRICYYSSNEIIIHSSPSVTVLFMIQILKIRN